MTCLNDGSTSIAARGSYRPSRSTSASNPSSAVGPEAVPAPPSGQDRRAGRRGPAHPSAVWLQPGPGGTRGGRDARPRPDRRAARARRASRRGRPAGRRSRAAIAGALVASDRRAHRRVAAREAGSCPASRRRPARPPPASRARRRVGGTGHRLDQRGGHDERQVADARRRPRRASAASITSGRAPQARASEADDRVGILGVGAAAPGTMTHGRSTNRSALPAS